MSSQLAADVLQELQDDDRDLYLYSGGIYQAPVNRLMVAVLDRSDRRRSSASLILTTYGGDAHQAYRLARLFQRFYKKSFRVVVHGPCKSAGTLVAVGADELAFGFLGELGPLDVQLAKPDEIALQSSGLDTLEALAMLRGAAFNAFEDYMVSIISKSQGAVSTKTACEVAVQLVSNLFRPIAQQIDPHRLSEVNRMMKIANGYGEKLGQANLRRDRPFDPLEHLIEDYPSHGFIIDSDEAKEIFKTVLDASLAETNAAAIYAPDASVPADEARIFDVVTDLEKRLSQNNTSKKEEVRHATNTQTGKGTRRSPNSATGKARPRAKANGQAKGINVGPN